MNANVIGLGRVGEATLRYLVSAGVTTQGLDIEARVVQRLAAEGLQVTTDHSELQAAEVYLFTTSTGADCANLLAAFTAVLRAGVPAGALLSIESTLPPGTMDTLAAVAVGMGRIPGRDLYLAHVPHRVLFGEDSSPFAQVRIAAGATPACLQAALTIYGQLGARLHAVPSPRVAELSKIVENALRFVDVAFAEALAQYCGEHGLDFDELRGAVNTRRNVHLLDADYGIGGECLPKDIRFLQTEMKASLLAGALSADAQYRDWLFEQLRGEAAVEIDGLSYKPGWKDLGFSQAVALVYRLQAAGVQVSVHDELFTPEELAAEGFRTRAELAPAARLWRGRLRRLHGGDR